MVRWDGSLEALAALQEIGAGPDLRPDGTVSIYCYLSDDEAILSRGDWVANDPEAGNRPWAITAREHAEGYEPAGEPTSPVAANLTSGSAGTVMRTGRTLSKESPVTGGLVTLYRVTAGDGPDVCVGAVPAAEADMIVRAVNEYFARYDGERVPVLRQALWDCYGAAGGDQDGDQACPPAGAMAPDVHVLAVEAVRELRRDYGEDEPLVRADERSRIALLAQEYGATYPTCPCQPERGIGDQSHIGGSPAPFADLIRGDQP
jgi:hypothetical protein